jgi:hypothetical protein
VGEGRPTDVSLVGIGSEVGDLGQCVRNAGQLGHPGFWKDRHPELGDEVPRDGEQVSVTGPLAVAVGGALDVAGSGLHRRDGVGDRAGGVVLAVDTDPETRPGHHLSDSLREL